MDTETASESFVETGPSTVTGKEVVLGEKGLVVSSAILEGSYFI